MKWNKHLDAELNLVNLGYELSDCFPFAFKMFSNYEMFTKDAKYIKIYKDSELIYTYYSTTDIYLIEFEHYDYITTIYQIDVLATNSKYSVDTEKLALTIHKEHKTHMYFDSYEWLNTSKHLSYCECRESIISSHIVKANSSICILCNGIANSTIGG